MSEADTPSDPATAALRMRASDADRDKVAKVLGEAFAEGRLRPDEYDERLAAVYQATTYAELLPVLTDLPVPPGTVQLPPGVAIAPASPAGAHPATPSAVNLPGMSGGSSDADTMAAVFGEFTRSGPWTATDQMNAIAIFGEGNIDFTQATLTSNEPVLTVVALFGEVTITIPPGMRVRSDVVAVLGSVNTPSHPPEVGPELTIKGAAIFGEVNVRHPKPPKEPKKRRGIKGADS